MSPTVGKRRSNTMAPTASSTIATSGDGIAFVSRGSP